MSSVYVSRTSQNRSPPGASVQSCIVQAHLTFRVGRLFLTLVSGLCGLCGRKILHKENKKWR